MINRIWDKVGICASGLCLIHCLATPILLLLVPSFKLSSLQHSHAHEIFAIVVVSSILLAVYPHCRKHGHNDIIAIAVIGVCLVISAILFHDMPILISHGITMLGSIFLITAHVKNMKVRHGKCRAKKHDH